MAQPFREEETTDELDVDKTVELTRSALHRLRSGEAGPRPVLLAIAGPAMGRMFELSDKPMTMGRSHAADIVLVDDGISRKHAVLEVVGDQFVLRDLGSTNGLFVNGKKIKKRTLENGDRIKIGKKTILKYSLQDELEEHFQKRMYDSAVRDSLTEVYNKRYFRESLTTDFAYHSRHNKPLSVVMLDIDHFKKINDTYGHLAGDSVLKVIAKVIGHGLRTEDILCRYGGEEFSIILRGIDADEAYAVAERIRKTVAETEFSYDDKKIAVTISLGVSTLKDSNIPSGVHLVRVADKHLYMAKETGRDRVVSAAALGEAGRRAGSTQKIL